MGVLTPPFQSLVVRVAAGVTARRRIGVAGHSHRVHDMEARDFNEQVTCVVAAIDLAAGVQSSRGTIGNNQAAAAQINNCGVGSNGAGTQGNNCGIIGNAATNQTNAAAIGGNVANVQANAVNVLGNLGLNTQINQGAITGNGAKLSQSNGLDFSGNLAAIQQFQAGLAGNVVA
ncbi:hypothetical protein HDU67_003859 [Dinochytrium kinnereticum]|nr:hypothetical protein HDU67_003859 [Dinochytrium kinnereticum]